MSALKSWGPIAWGFVIVLAATFAVGFFGDAVWPHDGFGNPVSAWLNDWRASFAQ